MLHILVHPATGAQGTLPDQSTGWRHTLNVSLPLPAETGSADEAGPTGRRSQLVTLCFLSLCSSSPSPRLLKWSPFVQFKDLSQNIFAVNL